MKMMIQAIRPIAARLMMVLGLSVMAAVGAHAADEHSVNAQGVMLQGYDPVAYFTAGMPTKGMDKFAHTWNNATYHFASAENRDKFAKAPETYAPQYGGFCAFGTAMGKKFDTDPEAWRIVDNKLYMNLNKDVQKRWLTDVPGYIAQANGNWPNIKTKSKAELN